MSAAPSGGSLTTTPASPRLSSGHSATPGGAAPCRYLIHTAQGDRCWLGHERRDLAHAFGIAVALLRAVRGCPVSYEDGARYVTVKVPVVIWDQLP